MAPRDRETDTHSNLVGGRERDGLHLTIRHTGLSLLSLSLSRPRGLLFPHFPTDVSLNDTVLIYCPSPHDKREKMLREGTEKILSRRGTRGGRREESEKDVINGTELLVCRRRRHAVTRRRTEAR